jgi:hypothetical protein
MKKLLPAAVLCPLLILSGCCTIINGSKQQVSVSSTPTGAKVLVDGNEVGLTPFIATLTRKDTHTLKIEMDGYQPYEISFARRVDGWLAGNIIFGGLIGVVIDAVTGSMYKLSPGEVNAALSKGNTTITKTKYGFYCAVTFKANPQWQKIGQLARAGN